MKSGHKKRNLLYILLVGRWEMIRVLVELCFVEGDKRELYFWKSRQRETRKHKRYGVLLLDWPWAYEKVRSKNI